MVNGVHLECNKCSRHFIYSFNMKKLPLAAVLSSMSSVRLTLMGSLDLARTGFLKKQRKCRGFIHSVISSGFIDYWKLKQKHPRNTYTDNSTALLFLRGVCAFLRKMARIMTIITKRKIQATPMRTFFQLAKFTVKKI